MHQSLCIVSFVILLLASCVPAKKFEDQKAMTDKYQKERNQCEEDLSNTKAVNVRLQEQIQKLEKEIEGLKEAKSRLEVQNRQVQKTLEELVAANDLLTDKQKEIIALTSQRQDELTKELAEKERLLNQKQDELLQLEQSLNDREDAMNQLQKELENKLAQIDELENKLAAKDEAMHALKEKIVEALKGYSASDLTIESRNGKIYVSMSEKLLFSSGSFKVDTKGQEAIATLAGILKKQSDVDIVVEGHTDSIPYVSSSGPITDNWDLSVKRATSVVRILVNNGLNPAEVQASGRSKYAPIADNATKEGQAKNRRTEIILSPKLDKIFDLLDSE